MKANAPPVPAGPPSSRGIALVIVLWMLVVLSIMAASFTASSRQDSKIVFNHVEHAKAQALLTAGLERAVLGLLDPEEERRWRRDGSEQVLEYAGSSIRVRIVDEKGKVDLNTGPETLIRGVMEAAGLSD